MPSSLKYCQKFFEIWIGSEGSIVKQNRTAGNPFPYLQLHLTSWRFETEPTSAQEWKMSHQSTDFETLDIPELALEWVLPV